MKPARSPFVEIGTSSKQALVPVGLAFPGPYRVAASSLAFQLLYRWIQAHPALRCERFVLDHEEGLRSLESGCGPRDVAALAVTVAWEPDLVPLARWLRTAGLAPLAEQRGPDDPPVLLGGSVTLSNPLPFLPVADLVWLGELEPWREAWLEALAEGTDRADRLARLARLPGSVGEADAPALPPLVLAPRSALPAWGAWTSPSAELANRFLVEVSRGCPRGCHFCVMRHPRCSYRVASTDALLDLDLSAWPRLGLIGAAVSEHPGLPRLLETFTARGQQVSLSSLRADVLDDGLARLLRAAGTHTLTLGVDGLSERLRGLIEKQVTRAHVAHAAELARAHGFDGLRLYQVAGLPGETDEDLAEARADLSELARRTRLHCNVSFLVPKRGTPLETAPRRSVRELEGLALRLRRALAPVVDLRLDSPRQAWLERVLSLGDAATGRRVVEAVAQGATSLSSLARALRDDPAARDDPPHG
jgi:radical SAM superfamily enzyme YgiQ (UPF0313 family)